MLPISLSQYSVTRNELITLRLGAAPETPYNQLQIEIITAGVGNPASRLGFGTTPRRPSANELEVDIDTQQLPPGLYEIGLARLHSPTVESAPAQIDFVPNRDFARQVFEIRASPSDEPRTGVELRAQVEWLEAELERKFADPITLAGAQSSSEEFTVLVFVKDLLVGVGMRFDHFEVVPTNSGLDGEDAFRFVNSFLQTSTSTGIQFESDDTARDNSRRSNPVCVLHIPSVIATSMEQARDYGVDQTNTLLLALALSRDAGGVIFDVVVLSKRGGSAVKYAISSPYIGNVLTGSMAGENFESVRAYMSGLVLSDTDRFLVGLYKEARRERSRDFQYVRYWQILETMAESNNYDPSQELRNFEGDRMTDDAGRPRLIKGSVNTVFNLLRENQIGNTADTWKHVNVWFAFRNAVAHHGAISQYGNLSRDSVREWALVGYEELQANPAHDVFLWLLKEDVKLLLMRRLVLASSSKVSDISVAI